MKTIKVFKHRLYYYNVEKKREEPCDEATTWEEALKLYEQYKSWGDVKIVSKEFDQLVV